VSINNFSETFESSGGLEQLYITLIENLNEGVLLCRQKSLEFLYVSEKAKALLGIEGDIISMYDLMGDDPIKKMLQGDCISGNIMGSPIQISAVKIESYLWVFVLEDKETNQMQSDFDRALELNKELREILENCQEEDIVITDGKGNIEFAGEKTTAICGRDKDFFYGKNVYDLEKEKYFYPSVSARVIETKETQIVMQTTKLGDKYISVGLPVFDEQGALTKVISFNRDYSAHEKMISLLDDMERFDLFEMSRDETESVDKDFILTCDEKMIHIKTLGKMIANINSTVLINGQTGTGKERIAKYIYHCSNRRNNPFIKVNCGTISPTLVESELFGYEPGTFTGANKEGKVGLIEAANGGTLFLDEVCELPLEQQVKLLHVLQERILTKVGGTEEINLDIRIIAATNKDLEEQVKKGHFREDLYYRLNVVPINIPSLKERRDDIPLLTKFFLKKFNTIYNMNKQITKNAVKILYQYDWPGNIRQLENTIERLVVTAPHMLIDVIALPEEIKQQGPTPHDSGGILITELIRLDEAVADVETQLIRLALDRYKTTTKAAEALGVNQSTISRKMAQYQMKK